MKQCKTVVIIACCAMLAVPLLLSQGSRNVDWPVYGGSPGSMRYSSLKQINQTNVRQLDVAWSYDAGDGPGTLETNPIVVDGVLYGYTTAQKVFAVNMRAGGVNAGTGAGRSRSGVSAR